MLASGRLSKASELLRFELRLQLRQPSFAAAALFFTGLGFLLVASGFGPPELPLDSPFIVAQDLAFVTLFALFAAAVFTSQALLRDSESKMEELIFVTPIARFTYLASRFAGAAGATLLTVGLAMLGMLAALAMPWHDPARIAPLSLVPYLYALAVIAVPNVVFATLLLFATAARTRSALATSVAAVLLYVVYFAIAAATDSPLMAASVPGGGEAAWPALFDPFALSALFRDTHYWTAAEKGSRLLPLAGTLLPNRLLLLGLTAALGLFVERTFAFRLLRSGRRIVHDDDRAPFVSVPFVSVPLAVASSPPASRTRSWLQSWRSAARLETRLLLRNGPMLVLLLIWIALAATSVQSDVRDGEYGSALLPLAVPIVSALSQPLQLFGLIVLIYVSGEAFWRERQLRLAPLFDATPVRGSVMIAAKLTALTALLALFTGAAIAVGFLMQRAIGGAAVDPLVQLSLAWFVGFPLVLYAAAALLIHALSPNRYVGMLLVLLFVVVTQQPQLLRLEHHLWRYAGAPPLLRTPMNGSGASNVAFAVFMLHWSIVAALFTALAALLWRGDGATLRERLRLVARRRRAWPLFAFLLAGALVTGGVIVWNTTRLNRYTTRAQELDWSAAYERRYASLASHPQPEIDAVETSVDLDSAARRCRIAGRYGLVNRSAAPIDAIDVALPRDASQVRLSSPDARATSADPQFGMVRVTLARPLQPRGRTTLDFSLSFIGRGFTDGRPDMAIVDSGSVLLSTRHYPALGYRSRWELTDAHERAVHGLPIRNAATDVAESDVQDEQGRGAGRVAFRATITTAADQTAITSGTLQSSTLRGGRRTFVYAAPSPIVNQFAIVSGRYQVRRARAGDVEVALYCDARHLANAERMLEIARRALADYGAAFGAYPDRQLALVEVPSSWPFGGLAMPGVVLLNESRSFLLDDRDRRRPDLLLRRVAHEVAHQWFGYRLVAADAPGASLLVESLTKYAELRLVETMRGEEQVQRLRAMELDRYLAARGQQGGVEPPLAKVRDDQPYLYYGKGAIVLSSIQALLGDARLAAALRATTTVARPTTSDLLGALRAVSTPDEFASIEEWLTAVVTYDLRIEKASVQRRPDGRYRVDVRVRATKTRLDAAGREQPVPMRESIELGAYAERPLDLALHPIHEGVNDLTLIVAERPTEVVIDPRILRVDRDRTSNRLRP